MANNGGRQGGGGGNGQMNEHVEFTVKVSAAMAQIGSATQMAQVIDPCLALRFKAFLSAHMLLFDC